MRPVLEDQSSRQVPSIIRVPEKYEAIVKALANKLQREAVDEIRLITEFLAGDKRGVVIPRPPGSWMLAVSGLVFSRKTKERVFDQVVADFRDEYFDALRHGDGRAKRSFIVARHWAAFSVAFVHEVASGIGKVIKALKDAG